MKKVRITFERPPSILITVPDDATPEQVVEMAERRINEAYSTEENELDFSLTEEPDAQ